jgi:hypothetical protein
MNFSRRHMLVWSVRFLAVAFGCGAAAGLLAILWVAGPIVEGRMFPIIYPTHVAGSVRYVERGEDMCWGVHFKKVRNDAPAYFNYRIVFQQKPDPRFGKGKPPDARIPLAVYRINEDGSRSFLSSYGFSHYVQGDEWTSEYCADIPKGIDLRTPFRVEGEGYYDTPHHLWLVPQALPTFSVPNVETLKQESQS